MENIPQICDAYLFFQITIIFLKILLPKVGLKRPSFYKLLESFKSRSVNTKAKIDSYCYMATSNTQILNNCERNGFLSH